MMVHVPHPITQLFVLLILLASNAQGSLLSPLPLLQRYSELFQGHKTHDNDCTTQNANLVVQDDVRLKEKAMVSSISHAVHSLQDKLASSTCFVVKNNQLLQRWQAVLVASTTTDASDGLAANGEHRPVPNSGKSKLSFNKGKLSNWWKRQSEGRSGLLVRLAPAVTSQYRLFRTAVPFCVDRMVQYLQPLNLVMLATLSKPGGIRVLRYGLWASIGLGGLKMLHDSSMAGSNWLPAYAQEDSYAVVTGASSGLGKELAKELFAHGYNLVLVASDKAKLEGVKASLSDSVPVISAIYKSAHQEETGETVTLTRRTQDIQLIPCDLANPMASFNILHELKKMNIENKIDVLVCNAGKGHYGAVHESGPNELRTIVDVNVVSTVNLIRTLLPRMLYRKQHNHNAGSRIVIVSSIAAAGPAEKVATYSASKAFLSSFAQSLRRELLPHGLMVTLAQPGPLKGTNFMQSANGLHFTPLMYKLPGMAMKTDVVAQKIFQSMRVGHDVITPGLTNKFFVHFLARVLPTPVLSSLVKHAWGPFPQFKSKSKHFMKGGIRMSYKPSNFRQKFVDFWFQPVVDYEGIKRWWMRSIGGGNRQSHQSDVAPSPVVDEVHAPVQMQDEAAELEATEKQEEFQASEHFKRFQQAKPDNNQPYEVETYVDAFRTEAMPTTKDSSDGKVESHNQEGVFVVPKSQGDGDAELIIASPTFEDNIDESDCFLFRSSTTTHWV